MWPEEAPGKWRIKEEWRPDREDKRGMEAVGRGILLEKTENTNPALSSTDLFVVQHFLVKMVLFCQ